MADQYSAVVRDIPADTEAEAGGYTDSFSSSMRHLVGQRVRVTLNPWGWFVSFPPDEFWFHRSWLESFRELE